MNKRDIRTQIKHKKSLLSKETIKKDSEIIAGQVIESPIFQECEQLFCYVSFNQEVITTKILPTALEMGKKVAVPKIENQEMKFYEIRSLEDLKPGILGILEPFVTVEAIPSTRMVSLFIVPGLAFDIQRNRIGYGKGYYDRYFVKQEGKPIYKLALAFDFQIFDQLPVEEYDRKVDEIITPTRVIL